MKVFKYLSITKILWMIYYFNAYDLKSEEVPEGSWWWNETSWTSDGRLLDQFEEHDR